MTDSRNTLLALDTATESCSAALLHDGQVDQLQEITANGHSRLLLDMVDDLMNRHGLDLSDLDALAVDIGPGSFTGIRIGLGVAQGLAYGAGLSVVPVTSLEALARQAGEGSVLPAIDARMDQIYGAHYELAAGPTLTERVIPTLASPDAPPFGGIESATGIGSGWDRYADRLVAALPGVTVNWIAERFPLAADVARLAVDRFDEQVSPLGLMARYVRNDVAAKPVRPGSDRASNP